jgi:serine/threonine-protein kinase
MIEVKMNEHDRMLLARITLVTAMSLLGGLAVGIAYAQQQGEEWSQYQNATYGVRMLYPSNWTQQNSTQQNSTEPEDDRFILVSEFFSPEEANGYFVDVTIAIDSMPQTTNIEAYRSQSIDIYRQDSDFEDLQLLSSSMGNFTLAAGAAAGTENATESMPAYAFEITYTDPEFGPQNMLEVGTIFDNRVYYIQYFADPPIYQKYFPIVERMIESFQIVH